MDERNYFVLCENNCKFPSMTKEQILTAIEQAVNNGEITNVDAGFVSTLKEQNKNVGLKFWVGTTAEYNALETKENNCFYILTDDILTEDFNAALAEMNRRIDDINGTLATELQNIDANFESVHHKIDDQNLVLTENISAIRNQIDGVDARVAKLETMVEQLWNKGN